MKISLANLNKIMDRCTKKEIDLIIYMGQFQDEYGVIKGIDYKDVLKSIDICKSTFYILLYGLESKGIININYLSPDYGYWEVTILDNVFTCAEDYKKGYMKLNYEILHTQAFINMTKSEKLIVFHLIKINDFGREKIKITYKKIMDWTGKSLRSVKKFIATLSNVFKIIITGGLCLIDCIAGFEERRESEANIRNKHLIDFRLKKAKCQSDEKDVNDAITVFKQYKINNTDSIFRILDNTINSFGTIVPKYINKLAGLVNV